MGIANQKTSENIFERLRRRNCFNHIMIKTSKKLKNVTVKSEPPKGAATISAQLESSKAGHISLELVQPGAKTVCVAGSFNEWKPESTPLNQVGNGRWIGDLKVHPGRYEYLFVVDGQWLPDPNAKETVENPFGGRNSVLSVSA